MTTERKIITRGLSVQSAEKALIMLHGRYGSTKDFASIMDRFKLSGFTVAATQAPDLSWYPYSFMAREHLNQPALDKSLALVGETVTQLIGAGLTEERIYFLGFSQGACLTLEYVARNARRYGGVVAFTGGLIGEKLEIEKYPGNLADTKILMTTGVPDSHVPLERVQESERILTGLLANVILSTYPGKSHGIDFDEITLANEVIFSH